MKKIDITKNLINQLKKMETIEIKESIEFYKNNFPKKSIKYYIKLMQRELNRRQENDKNRKNINQDG